MKKFLSKKPVMIALIVAAIIFLAIEIGILVRPVSYGLNYTQKRTETIEGVEYKSTAKLNIKSDKVARQTVITQEGDEKASKSVYDFWIYRDGHTVVMIGYKELIKSTDMTDEQIKEANESEMIMTKEEYEAAVKEIKDMKKESETVYKAYLEADGMEVGIFKVGEGEDVATNIQAIVFVSVHGVVTLALLTFAGLAIAFSIKKK